MADFDIDDIREEVADLPNEENLTSLPHGSTRRRHLQVCCEVY